MVNPIWLTIWVKHRGVFSTWPFRNNGETPGASTVAQREVSETTKFMGFGGNKMVVSNNEVPLNFCIGEKEQMFSPSSCIIYIYIYMYCLGATKALMMFNFGRMSQSELRN